jgi:hypothetical protein
VRIAVAFWFYTIFEKRDALDDREEGIPFQMSQFALTP